jgi:hypothetical protein
MGESGSPCLKPRAWQTLSPGLPLSSIYMLADDDSNAEIQFSQTSEKHKCRRVVRRKGHAIESKARARSIFTSTDGVLLT